MGDNVYGKWSWITNWRAVVLLGIAFLLCVACFAGRTRYLGGRAPDGEWPPLTPECLHKRLENFGEARRTVYAVTECTLDLIFPLAYTALFAAGLAYFYPRKAARWLVAVPLLAMAADLCENGSLTYLALTFPGGPVALARWAAACTAAKDVLWALSAALVVVGMVVTLVRSLWRRRRGAAAPGPGGAGT
jgi:hypothetical protein